MAHIDRRPRLRSRWCAVLAMAVSTVLAMGLIPYDEVRATEPALPLGDADLLETRAVQSLTAGVSLTRIVRGTLPAAPAEIGTTTRGPWQVNVLTIDPSLAQGRLAATYGRDLSQVETTTSLVQSAGALAGVNASYFATAGKSRTSPGDPVGLGLYRGALLSDPADAKHEVDLVVDAKTTKVLIGRLTWSGKLKNRRTGAVLKLKHLNHPPEVPAKCRKLKNPTTCRKSGEVVRFRPEFGPTPRGRGVEVVLDKSGCVVRRSKARGSTLLPGQISVQATGKQSRSLWRLTKRGCLKSTVAVYRQGKRLKLTSTMYGVAGRYHLTRKGQIVAPTKTGGYFGRNPRTVAGTTADGRVLLVTIDGRRPTSVGASIKETAAVAHALGLTESLNLDGGGSTAMSVGGVLVNQPSGNAERAVGDALVYVDGPR